MDLNRETAMRLWNKSFGKESKVTDFAGRMIAKGAYNDRNSEFGWNVDHILPQSKGGVTADHNLVCCHILTNDEKADKFPCFNSNGISFEIVKVERHYEIRRKDKKDKAEHTQESINLYDSAAGVRLFKSLKGIQNKKRFVGTVFVYLNYDMPKKSDMDELLDKCILLNTYMSGYFSECEHISGYDIYYREDYFEEKFDLFDSQPIKEPMHSLFQDSLFINELVRFNTEAESKVENNRLSGEYTKYNYVFTKLKNNLIKEANG